jgi:hypothetical protein
MPDEAKARWIDRRRLRYKKHPIVPYAEVRNRLRTGDIILFHKTSRSGFIDTLELDFVSPVFFRDNEFRHSGIVVRTGSDVHVLECAEERHSGYSHAEYPTGGKGIRLVPLEPLLDAYTRDNGDPHYGLRFIANEIPQQRIFEVLKGYGPISYLPMQRSLPLFLTRYVLPQRIRKPLLDAYRSQMMCSEFVHTMLHRCGALGDYPSKLFAPYLIEDDVFFRRLSIVPFSDIVRFTWPLPRQ